MKKILRSLVLLLIVAISTPAFSQSNALNFDGVDDYINTTYYGIVGNAPRTVEAWVRTTANCNPSSGGAQKVILDYGSSVTGGRFTFNLLWSNSVRLEVGGSGLSGTTAVNDGFWHHVAAVYDPSNSAGMILLYIDGALEIQGNISTSVNTSLSTPVRIGLRVDGVNPFLGDIDEVRIWNTARSAAQILASYNHELCNAPSGLVAYYTFNQGVAGGNNSGVSVLYPQAGTNQGGLFNFALSGATSNWVSGAPLPGATSDTLSAQACKQYTGPAGKTYTSSGTYIDTLVNAIGCDSLITLNLTIDTVDVRVQQNGFSLTAMASFASYQWLDCNNNFAVIPGATQSVYNPAVDGVYAVEITQGACSDTSDCYPIIGIGISELNTFLPVSVFPNPAQTSFMVVFPSEQKLVKLEVVDTRGRMIQSSQLEDISSINMDMNMAPGVYWVRGCADAKPFVSKLVIRP